MAKYSHFKRWLLLLISVCGMVLPLRAQDTIRAKVVLKFTPSMILDFDNTFTLGAEIPLSNKWSVQQEIGWSNSTLNVWDEKARYPDKNNWRFRTQARYYFSNPYSTSGSWYLALEYFRKEIFIRQYQALGRQCNSLTVNCAYFEEGVLRTRRRVSALHGKVGYQWLIPDRMVFDVYLGGGLRNLVVSNDDPVGQANTNILRTDLFNTRTLRPGKYDTMPSISAGFSIGFLVSRKKWKALPLCS